MENKKNDVFEEFMKALFYIAKWMLIILWTGLKHLKRNFNRIYLVITIIILAITVYTGFKYNIYCTVFPITYLTVLAGISKVKEFIYKSQNKVFEKINFKDRFGNYPRILKAQTLKRKDKRKSKVLIIKSLIPFDLWIKNKDLLEVGFDSKIAIKKTNSRQIIKLIKL